MTDRKQLKDNEKVNQADNESPLIMAQWALEDVDCVDVKYVKD